jgi:hypothetical protein
MKNSKNNTPKKFDSNSNVNQEIKGQFIGIHVHANVNQLIEFILSATSQHNFKDAPFTFDDIENFYSYPEWSGKVLGENLYFGGGSEDDKNNFLAEFERLEQETEELFEAEEISEVTKDKNLEAIQEAKEEIEALETEPAEVYEWWLVSDYLGEKLRQEGQVILEDGNNFYWGRQTTGQAILLDGVISRITSGMEILDGQPNSWAKK